MQPKNALVNEFTWQTNMLKNGPINSGEFMLIYLGTFHKLFLLLKVWVEFSSLEMVYVNHRGIGLTIGDARLNAQFFRDQTPYSIIDTRSIHNTGALQIKSVGKSHLVILLLT
jgi:hypothetical protein